MAIQYQSVSGQCILSNANPYLDGTGSIVPLITGAGYGTVIKQLMIQATQDVKPGMIRLFLKDPSLSGTYILFKEIPVSGTSLSGQTTAYNRIISLNNFIVPMNVELAVSTENSDYFAVTALGLIINGYY